MVKKVEKFITALTIASLLLWGAVPVGAIDIPQAPAAPEAPAQSSPPPPAPSEPLPPEEPQAPTAPLAPDNPTAPADPNTAGTAENQPSPAPSANSPDSQNTDPAALQTQEENTGGNVGDSTIKTGDVNNSGVINTLANNNLTAGGAGSGDPAATNSSNGADSTNQASISTTDNQTSIQTNNANVGNNLNLSSRSGENNLSRNVGDSTIISGDANTSGTILTAANTNLDGVQVAEFNVVDDQTGDIILDFDANCISGCSGFGSSSAANIGNGAASSNSADLVQNANDTTLQTNNATASNQLTLNSNSGNNEASLNTNGDSTIQTGDANVAANVASFLNNNLAGQVVLGVVNIFGDLVGDIILPQTAIANTENGASSTNNAAVNQSAGNLTFQNNDASIENNLNYSAGTGNNQTSQNTGGDSVIKTGTASVDSQTLNIANSNITGGDFWLVIVNRAGEWVGQIIGSPGSNFAGSQGTEFTTDQNGNINVSNIGNGADSQNDASVNQDANNTTIQNNNARIVNNVNLTASTGNNQANKNTGGNNYINTGDAKVIANLINFVNNNISGGRLVVTVVNVFGHWLGDFLPPGMSKPENLAANQENQDPPADPPVSENADNNSPSEITQILNIQESDPEPIAAGTPTTHRFYSLVAGAAISQTNYSNPPIIQTASTANFKDAKPAVKVNLAWLLILIPLLFTVMFLRRKLRLYG